MVDKPQSGEILGVPYNFDRPSMGRLLSAYWQPGKSMLVKKPFGVGYTLNLANWHSWVVLAAVGAMLFLERKGGDGSPDDEANTDPVEVIVDDD